MTKEDELSRYMALVEQYKEQIESLDRQFSYLNAVISDYNKAKITVEQLSKAEEGSEIMLPIGGGTYINANAKKTSKVLFDIGGGIVTEKTSDDTIKNIDKRIENLQETQDKISSMVQKLQNEAAEISSKAQQLLSEQQ